MPKYPVDVIISDLSSLRFPVYPKTGPEFFDDSNLTPAFKVLQSFICMKARLSNAPLALMKINDSF